MAQKTTEYIPEMIPLLDTSDFSNNDTNLFTSSGFNGGTRIGAAPAAVAGGGLVVPDSRAGAVVSTTIPSNRGSGPAEQSHGVSTLKSVKPTETKKPHLRCIASSSVGARPAWACPINRITTPKPDGVRRPLFSLSAICHIYSRDVCVSWPRSHAMHGCIRRSLSRTRPSVSGGNLVFSKKGTATSPVMTPRLVVSATWKSW